jgi:hypothetical protein
MREEFIKKMKEMGFAPRFLQSIPFYRRGWIFTVDCSPVNAEIDFNEKVEKLTSYLVSCPRYYSPHFRKLRDMNLIHENEFFSIYNKKYKDKRSLPPYCRKKSPPMGMIVKDRRILASFPCDYESSPVLKTTKITLDGQEQEIFFLSFLDKKETLAIICKDGFPKAFTGLPFAIDLANGNEVTLHGGYRATFSIDEPRGWLVFSF